MSFETLIVGAGPAGVQSALKLREAGVEFTLVASDGIGGSARNAFFIESVPQHPDRSGPDWAENLAAKLAEHDIELTCGKVSNLRYDKEGQSFLFVLGKECRHASRVIVATGTLPKRLRGFEIPSRTFYEVRHMHEVRGKHVIIVGSGEAAYDSAMTLASQENDVTILSKKHPPKISPRLDRQVKAERRIELRLGDPACEVSLRGESLQIRSTEAEITADFLFISIGRYPNLSLLGNPEVVHQPGFFVCGDAQHGRLGHLQTAFESANVAVEELLKLRKMKWN